MMALCMISLLAVMNTQFFNDWLSFILFLAAGGGMLFIAGLLHGEIHHMIFTYVQYLLVLPTFGLCTCTHALSNLI